MVISEQNGNIRAKLVPSTNFALGTNLESSSEKTRAQHLKFVG